METWQIVLMVLFFCSVSFYAGWILRDNQSTN